MTKLKKSLILAPLTLSLMAIPALAQDPFEDGVTVINDCLAECGLPSFETVDDFVAYLTDRATPAVNDGEGGAPAGAGGSPEGANGPAGIGFGLGLGLNGTQTVVLDFETGDPFFSGSLFGVPFTLPDHVYTEAEKEAVRARLEEDYGPYNFEFVFEAPAEGDFVTLQYNSNDNPGNGTAGILPTGGILFGSAGEIDFGNDNRSITAINDANLWTAFRALDPAFGLPEGFILELFSGVDIDLDGPGPDTGVSADEALSIAIVNQSANTGAHELGHGLGLRHYDAFGPIGGGLPSTGIPEPEAFFPVFAGPQDADETTLHIMSSGASSGLGLAQAANANRFFSERSAIKLTINERGRFVTDEQANSGQATLKNLNVPNPIQEGINADGRIKVRNIIVEGTIEELNEVDTLSFSAKAGEVFNAEMISDVEADFFPEFDVLFPGLTLYLEENGVRTEIARADDEFESFDAFMIDVVLPANGNYVLEMEAPANVFFDINGDGIPEEIPLALFGPETENALRLGQYITNAYIVESKNGSGPSKVGGPKK